MPIAMLAVDHLVSPLPPGDVRFKRRSDVEALERVPFARVARWSLAHTVDLARLEDHRSAERMRPPQRGGVGELGPLVDRETRVVVEEVANDPVGHRPQTREPTRS